MLPVRQIGRYRLDGRLGSGAFATVWLAHDDALDARVAVKVMADNWAHRMDFRERFLAEARFLRRVSSDSVVRVFDVGELPDRRPYFVMEYTDRGTLEDRITPGPLPVAEALGMAAGAARGVADLHRAGILHRDVKPSNVLVASTPGGGERILVADLGLAKSLAHASGLTQAVGSPGYTAPEQARPEGGIDERADVYGLGALLYHLVTGAVPGPPGQVVPPRRLRPDLPRGVERAVLRALEPDRGRRWPTADGFAREVGRLVAEACGERSAPRPRARRGRLLAAGAAVTLAASGGAVATARSLPDTRHAPALAGVGDATGRIRLELPARWARETVGSGWAPRALGLDEDAEPGLTVATDLGSWPDLRSGAAGVFVGLSEKDALPAAVDRLAHPGCVPAGSRPYRGAVWEGRIRTWTGCGGGPVEEITLARRDGGASPLVYVQIRRDGGPDATGRILEGLRVAGSS
ncbi:serine/threonine-protein kinase [Streptomyces sp. NPDC001380]|uniref:serine/threonine-protein kinase n=1 Tax=Streptomyces sp. NPDC001380 TaxID=3364566 RepID=UPI00369E0264